MNPTMARMPASGNRGNSRLQAGNTVHAMHVACQPIPFSFWKLEEASIPVSKLSLNGKLHCDFLARNATDLLPKNWTGLNESPPAC